MARKPNVNLTDTFETWRQKTNQISSNVGDPDNLTTPVTTDLVQALNEVNSRTTSSFIRGSVTLTSNNNAPHATLSYNSSTGIFTFASNTLSDSDIPSLDASKITTGVFADARIGELDACKITTGTLESDRLPVGAFEFFRNGLSSKTTNDLQEGDSNLYYTDQRVYAAIGIYPGDSTLDYNSATGQFRVNTALFNLAGGDSGTYSDSNVLALIDSAYINARVDSQSISPFNPAAFTGNIIPDTNETSSLGSATNRIKDLFISNNSIKFGETGKSLAYDSAGDNLTFDGASLGGGTRIYRQEIVTPSLTNAQTHYEWSSSNFPTGITRKPDTIRVKIVCNTANNGYSVGDEIYLANNFHDEAATDEGYNVYWSSADNSVRILFGQNAPVQVIDVNGRTSEFLTFGGTATQWDFTVGLVWYGLDADEDIHTSGTFTQI